MPEVQVIFFKTPSETGSSGFIPSYFKIEVEASINIVKGDKGCQTSINELTKEALAGMKINLKFAALVKMANVVASRYYKEIDDSAKTIKPYFPSFGRVEDTSGNVFFTAGHKPKQRD